MQILKVLWDDNQGQDIAEYAMMLAVIMLVVIGVITTIGTNAEAIFKTVGDKLGAA
jgi:pilus assembly protein Flp/PilA